jgi:hypothetical protein
LIWAAPSIAFGKIDIAVAASDVYDKYLAPDYSNAVDLQEFVVRAPGGVELEPSLVEFVGHGFALRKQAVKDARNSGVFSDQEKAMSALSGVISALNDAKGRIGSDRFPARIL